MLPYTVIMLIVAVLLIVVYAAWTRATPTRCRCGRPAIVTNDTRTRGQCYVCWLKNERQS